MSDPAEGGPAGVAETVRAVAAGRTTARSETAAALVRIAADDRRLNAFSVVLADQALAEADRRDAALAAGEQPGMLHGVPLAIKEEVAVAGTVTTYGGRGNSTPATDDAELVRRLRAAGAVVVGKTRMPEFGAFPYTESDAHGHTRNPWDETRSPGGSSGGTAAAVAAGLVPAGIGGDGGGSIRIPSACCGLFGLKPQRGRVTTAPEPHLWWALGTAGPLTRSVLDSALVYDVVRGNVDSDLYRAGPAGSFVAAATREPGRLRVGWSTRPAVRGVRPDPLHVAAVRDTARLLADLGHDVREVDPRYPDTTAAFVPQFFAGIRAEADQVEHYDRLERRTRQSCRMGVVGDAAGARRRAPGHRAGLGACQPGLRRRRRAADAHHGPPPSRDRRDRRHRDRRRLAAGAARDRVRRDLERRRQPRGRGPARARPRRPPALGAAGRPDRRRGAAVLALRPAGAGRAVAQGRRGSDQSRLNLPTPPRQAEAVAAIEVRDLAKTYGELRAVDGVTFEVSEGEFFGILGPNGAGKTTTLEMIEGLREPDAGSISVLGQSPWPRNRSLLPRIGVQLQASSFFERLTAREQLHTFAALYDVPSAEADAWLERVGMVDKADTRVEQLSGGQMQRLSIACALVHDPDVVFLDEPSASLDPQARRNLWDLLSGLNDSGRTVVLTTHHLDEAEALCDRVAIMDHGRVLRLDTPAALIAGLAAPTRITTADGETIETTDPAAALTRLAEERRLDGVSVRTATLEDVFLDLTGREYRA